MPHISPLWWVTLSVWFMFMLSISFIYLNWTPNLFVHLETSHTNFTFSEWNWS
uniref:ATP synthase F0 subunit 8 n=1 Tax=Pectinatella magnifica TaxID=350071 RepID=A0A344AUW4_9BILA|nr:ATP synthase F0 subunit 8 [Pectinatella magnifica]AWX65961.1 ATP synthase F0 subunit 8 [Pectinatella magnifica]